MITSISRALRILQTCLQILETRDSQHSTSIDDIEKQISHVLCDDEMFVYL